MNFISRVINQLMLILIRIFFGMFIGSFFGLILGGLVGILSILDKGDLQANQVLVDNILIFILIGALVGGIVGASKLLSPEAVGKHHTGKSIGGEGNDGGDGGGNSGGNGG